MREKTNIKSTSIVYSANSSFHLLLVWPSQMMVASESIRKRILWKKSVIETLQPKKNDFSLFPLMFGLIELALDFADTWSFKLFYKAVRTRQSQRKNK